MSLHDSLSASPTESLVLGRVEARKRCSVCSNTFHDAACRSQEGKGVIKSFSSKCGMNEGLLCFIRVLNQSRDWGNVYFSEQGRTMCPVRLYLPPHSTRCSRKKKKNARGLMGDVFECDYSQRKTTDMPNPPCKTITFLTTLHSTN